MKLVVGLGNPGRQYANNRHNAGFIILDEFARCHGLKFKREKLFRFAEWDNVSFLKPITFMNRSGNAVLSAISKKRFEDVLIIVDDIYLPLGEIRIRRKGGCGGHNGLRSIADAIGSEQFSRIRIGIDSPAKKKLSDYVLDDFSKQEFQIFQIVSSYVGELIEIYAREDLDQVFDHYSNTRKSYSEQVSPVQDRDS